MNKQRIFALCMALPLLLGGCAVRRDRGGEEETEKQLRVLPETEPTGARHLSPLFRMRKCSAFWKRVKCRALLP